jgi:hypothetical protein
MSTQEFSWTLKFHISDLKNYKNDKDYITEKLLPGLIKSASGSPGNDRFNLYYISPYDKTPLHKRYYGIGIVGCVMTPVKTPNQGMDPELFEELENEFHAGIRKLNHKNNTTRNSDPLGQRESSDFVMPTLSPERMRETRPIDGQHTMHEPHNCNHCNHIKDGK